MATVRPAGNAQHLPIGAEIFLAVKAMGALPTKYGRVEGYPRADGQIVDPRSNGIDRAGRLVPHHEGRDAAPRRPGESMNIAPTDPTGGHADANLPGARLGHFNFRKGEFPRGREQQRFHGGSLMGRGGRTARSSKRALIRSAAGGARPTPRVPREFFTVSSERKEVFPGKFPGFHEPFPAPLNPIMASLAASRPTPGGSWNAGNRARTLVDPLGKGDGVAEPGAPRRSGFRGKQVLDKKMA
jgi:hypothetical protein